MIFSERKTVDIQSQQSSRLVLTFNYADGGIRSGISGNYIITLEKD